MHNELLAGNELGRAIRAVNRTLLEEFNKIAPIAGTTMLDAGGSIQGFALEAASELGVATYEAATLSYVYWQSPLVEFKGDGGLYWPYPKHERRKARLSR